MTGRIFKHIVMVALLLFWTVGICGTAVAARRITSISIEVEDCGEDYPEISVNGSNYYIDEITYDKGNENLTVGTIVRPLVTLVPESGCEFKVSDRKNIHITGSGAGNTVFNFVKGTDEFKVLVIYTISGVPEEPENVEWGNSSPWIAWADTSNADSYEFSLYKGNELIERKTQVDHKYDFAKALSRSDVCERSNVYFGVRAIFKGNYSEAVYSDYYGEWGQLKDLCDKVTSYEWRWSDTNSKKESSTTSGSTTNGVVPYPGAS